MSEYVIVKYKFQLELCKTEPLSISIYDKIENAELKCKELHREEWSRIIKEEIKNDTFNYYSSKLKSKGLKFSIDANDNEISEFVNFIETGEVEDPYVGKTSLKPIRIVDIEVITAQIESNSSQRFLVKEDYLYDTGEVYVNPTDNNYGTPKFLTDNLEVAKSKLEELEIQYFIDKVLGHNPRMNLQTSRYWKDAMYLDDDQLDQIELKLNQSQLSLSNLDEFEQINQVRQILKDVAGIGIVDNFYSIDNFTLNN